MNNHRIRWKLAQDDIEHLSAALDPIRSQEEVAVLLGCSPALVGQLERSALRKILRAIAQLETNASPPRTANYERTET